MIETILLIDSLTITLLLAITYLLAKRVNKLEIITKDVYKDHHEHILTTTRDNICCDTKSIEDADSCCV